MKLEYNYPYKHLWEKEAWDTRKSEILPLARWIGRKNLEKNRIPAKPENERQKEGKFDSKANALTNPKVVEFWKAKGLQYHCTNMTLSWISMIPIRHTNRRDYVDEMDTILILVNADQSDPCWCMYVLEKFKETLENAAVEKCAVIFVASDKFDESDQYISILQEAVILFHLNYCRIFLDITALYQLNTNLDEIEGLNQKTGFIERNLCGIPVMDISGKWTNKTSLTWGSVIEDSASNLAYNKESLINSITGMKLAKAIAMEYEFDDARDPVLLTKFANMGLLCEFHETLGEQWITFTPDNTRTRNKEKLPCVCILQEVNRFDPHQAVTAFSFFYEFLEIAAQGECMLLFFALESFDDNELLHTILDEAENQYPLDRSRVYITGHSHNGRFSAEYSRRHPLDIAALATLGNEPGQLYAEVTSGFFVVSDEQLDIQAAADIPTINISGFNERNSIFPLHSDPPHVRPGQWVALNTFEKRSISWKRRLRSSSCPDKTVEEIVNTKNSRNSVERLLGIPADSTEVLFLDGEENYIVDIMNKAGKNHLRIAALGNMPHLVTPSMLDIAWSFVRRFAKNRETGECIELY